MIDEEKVIKYFNKYRNLPIVIYQNTIDNMLLEVNFINNYFKLNYNINYCFSDDWKIALLSNSFHNGLYVRFSYIRKNNLIVSGRGDNINHLKLYNKERIFTILDIKNNTIKNILTIGSSKIPTYIPKILNYE
jgi:hypothetical protein